MGREYERRKRALHPTPNNPDVGVGCACAYAAQRENPKP